ncbi:MAG: glycosyltransferase family 2 protein [Bacteroidaceae bacterium]|nr:glycosyltransferase family 2 protein [Bacteroidaceae bacterium]
MKLSIVIVSYNVKYFIEQCLRSVQRAIRRIEAEVFVVDNASSDGSCEYLTPLFPDVTFIWNKDNRGFARANNQAIRMSTGEYVLLLNPDTIVAEETLEQFVEFMDSNSQAGGAGAYMLRTDGKFALESRRGLPTPFVAFSKMSGLAGLFPKSRLWGRYYMRYLDEQQINEIEIISGAFMFLRREALQKSGLLDEAFFMYGEDIDLSYRIMKAGYKNFFLPSRILHYKGESTVKSSYRYVYTFYQAMQLFFNKHYAHYSLLVSLPISIAIWVRAMMAYVGNQFRHRRKKADKPYLLNAIVVGVDKAVDEIRDILQREQPDGMHKYIATENILLSKKELTEGGVGCYDTIVFDADTYCFGQMFQVLESVPHNRLKIATYSMKSGVLITEGYIYKRKDK